MTIDQVELFCHRLENVCDLLAKAQHFFFDVTNIVINL